MGPGADGGAAGGGPAATSGGAATKRVSLLVKPASSACGMRCRYCFYRDVAERRAAPAAPMTTETAHALIDRALAVAPDAEVAFAFQGGEPTATGLGFYQDFVAYVDARRTRQRVSYAFQTNGLAVAEDPAWADFLAAHDVLVGVSVDGWEELHDALRPDAAGRGTYVRAMRAVRRLRSAGAEVNVLTVLTHQLAQDPARAFDFLLREGVDFVQYVPCLPELGRSSSAYSLTPRDFASFYQALLDLWLDELARGHYVSVALFDDVMRLSLGQLPLQCGALGRCAVQLVVEGSGAVYPCDFYALDEWRCGNVREDSLEELAGGTQARRFLSVPRRPCSACATCGFEGLCHRNCRRLGVALYDNEGFCGYCAFLERGFEPLARAARQIVAHEN